MKQVNIKDLDIKINTSNILNALSLNKEIEIDINGKVYIDEQVESSTPIIFKLNSQEKVSSLLDSQSIIMNIFKNYKPVVSGTICNIKPLMAWQEIISLNQEEMLYFDHHNDGVELFEDKVLEDYGWNCTPCDITYREITEFIESNCEGTFLFYDNDIQFNGFVLVKDIIDVRKQVKEYIIKKIEEKIEDESIDIEDDEVIESLEFFEIKV